MSQGNSAVDVSVADVWYLKDIQYGFGDEKKSYKIITQNFNGPCSFIAICNILILRGNIVIQPPERKTVSYEFLSHLVAEYLLLCSPDIDVSDALSIMPLTQKGMDLNPVFTSSTSFKPSGIGGGELKLFEYVDIQLVHGWLVDPDSQEAAALSRAPNYDAAVELIAEVDHLTNGKFVLEEVSGASGSSGSGSGAIEPTASGSSSSALAPRAGHLSEGQQAKIADAIAVREFLDHSQSQLTYHGLFQLASTLKPNTLVALFRNSHLSVLLKTDDPATGPSLYTLVTDQVFVKESSVVWEKLEDVDGGWSTFVDSDFVKSSPAGGDFAGQTAEDALKAMELMEQQFHEGDPADLALAQQLQAEEEHLARQERRELRRQHEEQLALQQQREEQEQYRREQEERQKEEKLKKKKSKDCIIM